MIFVILCGGSGTRLWPLSRSENPKQLHSLVTERTLLQDTVMRVKEIAEKEDSFYYFVTSLKIVGEIESQVESMGISKDRYRILVEPVSRNSCPAILMATIFMTYELPSSFQDQFITVMSSDHAWDDSAFCQIISKEKIDVFRESIITIGIQPSFPHTGYGYIQRREGSEYEIREFREKPNLEMAKKYVEEGYLWNSGTFIYRAETLLCAFRHLHPEMLLIGMDVYSNQLQVTDQMVIFQEKEFAKFPNIAFDVAIMEKIDNGIVLSYKSSWSDIGSFDAVYDLGEKDGDQNVIKGEKVIIYDTQGSYIRQEVKERVVAVVGMENVVVVDTKDALIVMSKDRCQDIKKIIEKLPEEYK